VPWPWEAELTGDHVTAEAWNVRSDDPDLAFAVDWFCAAAADAGATVGPGGHPVDVRVRAGVSGAPAPVGVDPRGASVDERYVLSVGVGGVHVEGETPAGVFRGLSTLLQLVEQDPGRLPTGRIDDGPRYAWRGLMLDVVRHPFGADAITAVVDLLARYRFNVLHLHLTDSEGWMAPSAARPELPGGLDGAPALTLAQYERIVEAAAARHVVVVPEVDLPGHALAALRAYPELGPDISPGGPPVTYLDPTRPGFGPFVDEVVREFAERAPGPFLHVGGDEPFGMPHEQYGDAVRTVVAAARAGGRRVVAWQEAVRSGSLREGDVVQYWIGPQNVMDPDRLKATAPAAWHDAIDAAAATFRLSATDLPAAIHAGHSVLVSNSDVLYLDHRYAEPAATPEGEARRLRLGFDAYPARTLREMGDWSLEAMPQLEGAAIAGIEAGMWAETVESFDDLAFLLLPRLATVAERAWTHEATGWDEHCARLDGHRDTWSRTGWGAAYAAAHSPAVEHPRSEPAEETDDA
jgi:hexosaminidase